MKEKSIDINALHSVQLTILKEFDRVCRENDIEYFLAYGTLLGAIRHNGFIPWDDDIDVFMKYSEYCKLKMLPNGVWKTPFFLQTPETDKEYKKCYIKLRKSDTTLIVDDVADLDINHGVDIDIYPIFKLTKSAKMRKRQYRDTMTYMLLQVDTPPVNHGKIFYYGGKIILGLLPTKLKKRIKNNLIDRIAAVDNTPYSYVINGNIEIMRQVFKNVWFEGKEDHPFEDGIFPIPKGWDEWLRSRYGDNYMDLPPENKRGIKLEQFMFVDVNNPYIKYKGVYYCSTSNKKRVKDDRIYDFINN